MVYLEMAFCESMLNAVLCILHSAKIPESIRPRSMPWALSYKLHICITFYVYCNYKRTKGQGSSFPPGSLIHPKSSNQGARKGSLDPWDFESLRHRDERLGGDSWWGKERWEGQGHNGFIFIVIPKRGIKRRWSCSLVPCSGFSHGLASKETSPKPTCLLHIRIRIRPESLSDFRPFSNAQGSTPTDLSIIVTWKWKSLPTWIWTGSQNQNQTPVPVLVYLRWDPDPLACPLSDRISGSALESHISSFTAGGTDIISLEILM